jgi:hypothetical protein
MPAMIHWRFGCLPRVWPARVLLLALAGLPVAHAATDWADIEARIQYAFYVEDARALGALRATLAAMDEEPRRDYYLALTDYRLGRLTAPRDPGAAAQGAADCVTSLGQALRHSPDDAEDLALQASCLDERVHLRPIDVPFAAARSRAQMRHALLLAPANPRVQLLHARQDHEYPAAGADRARSFDELQRAVAAFERERQDVQRLPQWGLPEAYVDLARSCLERGDALAARAALEHALLLAPDFVAAHRLLSGIVS